MKLTIIGGAGIRVPLVTNGLFRSETTLTVDELALFDTDPHRAKTIGRISRAMARRAGGDLRVTLPESLEEALEGCSFVLTSIRVGGMDGRVHDEQIALGHGLPGQETVGPGGFALALRTIPAMVEYARRVATLAPKAWMINFTNPVGIMAEAFIREGVADRCIGVCDTPREQFLHISEALGIPLESAFFDYLGLNHLGWIRAVLVNGHDVLPDLLASDEAIDRAYPVSLFSKPLLRQLGLLPTEYLFYYYSPREAYRRTRASGNTRGGHIKNLEGELMATVDEGCAGDERILDAYDLYLAKRNASYMSIEAGAEISQHQVAQARTHLYQRAAGYERIALDVMGSIHNNEVRVIPVDVANQGAMQDLDFATAVEVPCAIDSNGARPLSVGHLPEQVRSLLLRVKDFERITVRAAMNRSASLAETALAANPLVESRDLAEKLVSEYRRAHSPELDYLV